MTMLCSRFARTTCPVSCIQRSTDQGQRCYLIFLICLQMSVGFDSNPLLLLSFANKKGLNFIPWGDGWWTIVYQLLGFLAFWIKLLPYPSILPLNLLVCHKTSRMILDSITIEVCSKIRTIREGFQNFCLLFSFFIMSTDEEHKLRTRKFWNELII